MKYIALPKELLQRALYSKYKSLNALKIQIVLHPDVFDI